MAIIGLCLLIASAFVITYGSSITSQAVNLITGKASQDCITDLNQFVTKSELICLSGETKKAIADQNGCIISIGCVLPTVCENE